VKTTYDQIAGQSAERLAALSDGIFGVAMTLLLLDLHVPARDLIHSEADLWRALLAMAPQVVVYLMSFGTLGIFWIGQQTQLNHLARSDRPLTWIHLGFLFAVTLMPFSTRLLVDFMGERPALIAYWFNIVLLGGMLYCSWSRATRRNLVKEDIPDELKATICHRIITAQALYGFGASLCLINTYVSITVIVLLQLNYIFAPPFWKGRAQARS
jgi:uncharacterized membrane protein